MIRILVLEDNRDDFEMVVRSYQGAGLSVELTRVESEPLFREALREGDWDLVLLDYALPRFNGVAALDLTRRIQPETPAVILSGVMEDDLATESLKIGAADYVTKNKLERLVPITERLLRLTAERKDLMRRFRLTMAELKASIAELKQADHTGTVSERADRLSGIAAELESLATALVASRT